MHTSLTRLLCRVSALVLCGLCARVGSAAARQDPVRAVTQGASVVQRAQALIAQGQHDSATLLLDRHLTREQNDGHAWFFLGRIYLEDVQQWHRTGHPPELSSALLLDFASTSFERAQELLTDSGGVFRIAVAIERAMLSLERFGWDTIRTRRMDAEELPLPPVLAELGRNLMTSCPRNGVLLPGSFTEMVAVWGMRLQRDRPDLIILRPDLYQTDPRYRARMAPVLGADPAAELPAALAAAARNRAVCLGPAADKITAPGLEWYASRLVLSTAPPPATVSPQLTLFHLAHTGLAGSVWAVAARDSYDLAARRNRALCTTLFTSTDALTLPAIPACTP
jgi:hypothetical protein